MSNDNAPARWKVTLTYRLTHDRAIVAEKFVEELDEIADLIERGPDWNTLIEGRFELAQRGEREGYSLTDEGRS